MGMLVGIQWAAGRGTTVLSHTQLRGHTSVLILKMVPFGED